MLNELNWECTGQFQITRRQIIIIYTVAGEGVALIVTQRKFFLNYAQNLEF